MRDVKLLVDVRGLSGTSYEPGTIVRVRGRGSAVDGWVDGDWLPLSWWEFAELDASPGEPQTA